MFTTIEKLTIELVGSAIHLSYNRPLYVKQKRENKIELYKYESTEGTVVKLPKNLKPKHIPTKENYIAKQ